MEPCISAHDCHQCSVEDFITKELVCLRCGVVTKEPDNREIFVTDIEGKLMNAIDHYSGNALLNSETENIDYVSAKNRGLAFKLPLNDSYRSGCIAGGKEVILKEDPITHEVALKFDMYDKPMLRMVKERANSELLRYSLSTVEMTLIAKECKTIVSRLVFSDILEYAWRAAVIRANVLKEKDASIIEQEMYALLDPIRIKLLSRCDSQLAKELAIDKNAAKAKPIEAK